MRLAPALVRLGPKLLLSYLLVIAVGVGAVVLGVVLVAPSIFDRLLLRHMGSDMMDGGMAGSLRRDTSEVFQAAVFQSLALATVAATVAAILISAFVARRITSPIARMAETSRRIARGEYAARVLMDGQDEIGELAGSLNTMAAALEDAERRRVHLIGDVAHEIRTPLATLRGYLEGLQDGVVVPSHELWAQLHGETERLQRLIDDLRELSQVEAGQVALVRRPLPPGQLIQTAVTRMERRFTAKGVALQTEVPSRLPAVFADETRALQVLTNLLSNALRYTAPGGSVSVSARVEDSAVRFDVRDTGIGIPPEHLAHIFDRFYRVDPARSRALGGSGVGLTIAHALAAAQGGELRAASAGAGYGSTFTFTLPRARS